MAAVNRLDAHPVEFAPAGSGKELLILFALSRAGARTCLVDELTHDLLAGLLRLSAQARELIRDADAVLDLIVAGAADVEGSAQAPTRARAASGTT
ncbi:MAG: hypothetical protein WCF99_01030 [Chloroflexales bacterium]